MLATVQLDNDVLLGEANVSLDHTGYGGGDRTLPSCHASNLGSIAGSSTGQAGHYRTPAVKGLRQGVVRKALTLLYLTIPFSGSIHNSFFQNA